MKLTFDENGCLTPYQVIETDLDVFEKSFAFNKHRRNMFGKLLNLMEKLTLLDTGDYFLWVNGSFVTRKKFPKDIDLVTFIDYRLFNPLEKALFTLGSQYEGALDCYFSRIFPENHKLHNVYQWAMQDWFQLFSSTRVHPISGQINPKGFIQLNSELILK